MNLLWVYFLIGALLGVSIGVAVTGWIRNRADAKRWEEKRREREREYELDAIKRRVKRLELIELDKHGV